MALLPLLLLVLLLTVDLLAGGLVTPPVAASAPLPGLGLGPPFSPVVTPTGLTLTSTSAAGVALCVDDDDEDDDEEEEDTTSLVDTPPGPAT